MSAGANGPYQQLVVALNKDIRDFTPVERLALTISVQPGEVVLMLMAGLLVLGLLSLYNHYTVMLLASLYAGYMSLKVLRFQNRHFT